MKTKTGRPWTWLAIGTIAFSTGCGEPTGPGGSDPDGETSGSGAAELIEVTLALGQEVTVGAVGMTFSSVVEDSRCPVDLTCVWEGNAAVELTFMTHGEHAETVVLNTALEPQAREAAGLRVTLLEVRPLPMAASVPDEEDYRVRVRVAS